MQSVGKTLWKLIESIVRWFLNLLFKILHKELHESTVNAFLQFVKFGIVGLSNTIISYVLYAGSLFFMEKTGAFPHADYLIAQVIAFLISVLWSFYWNNKYVFGLKDGQKRSIWKSLLKTYVSYSFTGLFLNSILLVLWVQILHISKFIAPIINLIVSVPLNFIINKVWAFRSSDDSRKAKQDNITDQ